METVVKWKTSTDMAGPSKSDSGSETSLPSGSVLDKPATAPSQTTASTPADETTIDELMSLDPLELAKDPAAIDAIIAYHRNNRANAEAGIVKPKKENGPKLKLDLSALGFAKAEGPTVKRRV